MSPTTKAIAAVLEEELALARSAPEPAPVPDKSVIPVMEVNLAEAELVPSDDDGPPRSAIPAMDVENLDPDEEEDDPLETPRSAWFLHDQTLLSEKPVHGEEKPAYRAVTRSRAGLRIGPLAGPARLTFSKARNLGPITASQMHTPANTPPKQSEDADAEPEPR